MTIKWLITLACFSILCWSADVAQAQVKSIDPFYSNVSCKGRHDLLEDRSVALIGSSASVEFEVRTDSVILYLQSEFNHGNSFVITINDL